MLEVVNISKTYSGEDLGAVNDVSFSLGENQVLALIGKSGSGKSTILQMIAGLMKPDSGHVSFSGEELENPDEQLIAGHSDIKIVFQDFQLKPNMTVEENVKYVLLQFDKQFQEERTAELLQLCGIGELAKRKPNELSGGQLQRLSIASVLAEEPKLLLMDEPFSNLDPLTKENLLIELVDIIKSEALSLIFVTHDTRDAMWIADRMAFLSEGSLIQIDAVQNIYNAPINLEIAGFFGRVNAISDVNREKISYIRAEDCRINEPDQGIGVVVSKSVFLGHQYFNEAINSTNGETIHFYSKNKLKANEETVFLTFDEDKILHFN
ncbi:ABC transporter ATP-binding protein [Roseivirga sp.]|uniref:ABC transporter ATP-binding protein n=1 Tax=Roseivirga sp. TaxID=1964215 RepID=UPI003B8D148D